MKTTIQNITTECTGRIIVTSDVHGHGHYLRELLRQLSFSKTDTLVIAGDLIEKGGNSLETLRYVAQLKKENPHVYMILGNVDMDRIGTFMDQSEGHEKRFLGALHWTKKVWKRGLFLDILDEMGIALTDVSEKDIAAIKERIAAEYGEMLEFLWNAPTMIECGNYIFVHAGLTTDRLETLAEEDAFQFMKMDAFLERDVAFERCVVVGHWPVCLYRTDVDCMNPIFDYERHIISIDGGCGLKTGAQLNAIVIPHPMADMHKVQVAAYDKYPVMYAKTPQSAAPSTICIKYFDGAVELLAETEDMATLRHQSSGIVFDAPKKYLYHRGEQLICDDYIDAQLEIAAGDAVKLVLQTSVGAIVKKDGLMGWYRGILQQEESDGKAIWC